MEFNSIIRFTGSELVNREIILELSNCLHQSEKIEYESFFFTDTVEKSIHSIGMYSEKKIILHEDFITKKYDVYRLPDEKFHEAEMQFGSHGNSCLGRFYCYCNELTLEMLADSKQYPELLVNALDFLIGCSIVAYGNIERGSISFMSHSNGFFTRFRNIEEIREKFEDRYQITQDIVKKSINNGVLKKSKYQSYIPTLDRLERLKEDVYLKIKENKLIFPNNNGQGGSSDLLYRSKFHSAIKDNSDFLHYMNENKQFLTSRVYTIFSYLVIKKLGVKNVDRYLLAYLMYRGVEDLYGIDAISLINNFSLAQEGSN